MIDKSIRQHYATQGGKRKRFLHGSMGAQATPDVAPGGGASEPGAVVTTAVAPPSILSRPDPVVTTAVAPPSILARETPITTAKAPPSILARDKVVPPSMLGGAKDALWTPPKDTTVPPSMRGGAEDALWTPPIKDIVDLGDDAKTRQVQILQKKADLSWQNKSTYEKEEQQEKWDAAESKIKLQKGGGFWKSLGNIALAMILPALLPAKLARGYNLYKTAKNATAFANRFNLFGPKKIDLDKNVMQFVKKNIFKGVDIQKAIAGKETEFAKSVAKFSGEGADSNKEYTEQTIGKVQTAKDVEPAGQITNEERQKYRSQLDYMQGILQSGYYTNKQGETIQLTDDHRRQLSDYMNQLNTYLNPTTQGIAHGGLIDSPLTGGSRYI